MNTAVHMTIIAVYKVHDLLVVITWLLAVHGQISKHSQWEKNAEVFECTCKQRALYSLPVYLYVLFLITVNFCSP